ncbi:MAG: dienelactone hydrolase family protein [Candidatus Eisenbacteria bacterium]|nr:dienelactone hydrolase family protein [Candidatus Eisenbacteria bacterium]
MTSSAPDGYLAAPTTRATHGTVSAVLVLHAWWGLNETTRGLCRRLADAGFLAFAPDLYHGKVADTIEGAEALSQALDAGQARADISAAMRFLTEQAAASSGSAGTAGTAGIAGTSGISGTSGTAGTGGSGSPGKLGVIGFSLGAYFALELSNQEPERIGSVVVFYGTGHTEFGRSEASYLGHFAESDPYESAAAVEELEQLLRKAGRPVTFHQYPGTGHWFFEPDRAAAHNALAADLAWNRTLAFLRRNAE